jgi:predicted DCC family thiol-disulfide oxidoreductase YuxK
MSAARGPSENDVCDKPTVYFDGACPLCRREIAVYQNADGAADVQWVDVAAVSEGGVVAPDLAHDAALARFHVRRANGELLSGAAAFAALWLALPRWRWLGRFVSLPGVRHLAEGAYRAFLLIRPAIQRRFRGP